MTAEWAWLFDVGSTFTKVTAVDLGDPGNRFQGQAPTTVTTDVRTGFTNAVASIENSGGPRFKHATFRAASSSAAGGLAMVVSGLVPRLSAEAGRIAALGAGAKLVGTFSYRLTDADLLALQSQRPDIVLLTGGTDGGERETLVRNAQVLSGWPTCPTVIVAGNREVAPDAVQLLRTAGVNALLVPNILPDLDTLVVGPAREAIHQEFLSNIVHAKGIDRVRQQLDCDIEPTPAVVLGAVRLLAERLFTRGVMVVEVGGATTNVHSWTPAVAEEGVVVRGLVEPGLNRTVEGDLGVRWNASTILDLAGLGWFEHRGVVDGSGLTRYVAELTDTPWRLPRTASERGFDSMLATYAAQAAIRRHCGRRREVMLPDGPVLLQEGRDLRSVDVVIGTGGSVISGEQPAELISSALGCDDPFALVPIKPRVLIDRHYTIYAAGLLASGHADAAVELTRQSVAEPAAAGRLT